MTGSLHLRLLAIVLCCAWVHASPVKLGYFEKSYGLTGCISNPTSGCGRKGDICYDDRGNSYSISGTAPMCSACMPNNFRNIATFSVPINLPCALWSVYGCDDYFVSHVFAKMGNKSCWMGGAKSYNIYDRFSSAQEAQDTFVRQCRELKSFADYGLPDDTRLINEEDFCFLIRNNITDITSAAVGTQEATVLFNYKEYYEKKFNVIAKSTDKN